MIIVDGTRSGQFRANDGEWKTPDKFVGLFGSKWNWNRVGTKWTPVFSQRSLVWKTPVKTAKMWRDFLFSFFFIERRFLSGRASISLRNLDFSLLFFFSFLSFFFFSSFSFSSLYFFFFSQLYFPYSRANSPPLLPLLSLSLSLSLFGPPTPPTRPAPPTPLSPPSPPNPPGPPGPPYPTRDGLLCLLPPPHHLTERNNTD